MNLRRRISMLGVSLAGCLAVAGPGLAAERPLGRSAGIVVEHLRPGSTADLAGLAPGDVLLSWRRAADPPVQPAGERGRFSTPFELMSVFVQQLPRGPVILSGRRGGRERSWTLPGGWPSAWQEVGASPVRAGRAAGRGQRELAAWNLFLRAQTAAKAGRWQAADALYRRALAPLAGRLGSSTAAAHVLRRWGDVLRENAVWERAEGCYRRALALDRGRGPDGLAAAASLTGLGYIASFREGTEPAEPFYRQALAIRERLAPGSSDVAASWYDLFHDAFARRDPAAARERLKTALALEERATPESLYVAGKLTTLGINELAAGEPAAAREHLARALALAEHLAPEDENVPYMLQGLGMAAAAENDLPAAVERLRRAAALAGKLAPTTYLEADILHDLGLTERQAGVLAASAEHLCKALEFPERRYRELTGNNGETGRLGFLFGDYYRDCTLALARAGQAAQALHVLERGRARAFLHFLSERALRVAPADPGSTAERRRLDAEHDRVQAALGGLDPTRDAREIARLEGRLREIYQRRDQRGAEARAASDRFATLEYPRPLDLDGVRRALDPGTVLAEYAVGRDESWLFVVQPPGAAGPPVAAFPLGLGAAALGAKIAALRHLLEDEAADHGELAAQAAALYDLLLRPAEPLLSSAERLVLSPDGPLHTLPFAALQREGRFLIEWKPLHFALSATTYAEIRRARRPRGEPGRATLAAFGAPEYPPSPAAPASAGGDARGFGLTPLPGTRREVERIAALFPRARLYLGREATEERAKRVGRDVRYLHFAVHGLLDQRSPLESALALSPPKTAKGRDNGLLQAWEIVEEMRLDADLVTLSACDTALGRDRGGEGLIGLTRAFQYAGAHSVLAALWSIPDDSTADLMAAVYAGLRAGKTKDEALRNAQIERIRAGAGAGTAGWSAFQLYGDWR